MPRKKKAAERYVSHTYSVWVDTVNEDGTISSDIAYFGSSAFSARLELSKAIIDNPEAARVEYRVDMHTVARVEISHPQINWPWQL